MATPNQYAGYCCKCNCDVGEGAGIVRRYSGANRRSAPAGSRSRRTAGYNGMNSDTPGSMGKYAVWCINCDDEDQEAKKVARKLQKLNEKIYLAWNDELYRLSGIKDDACRRCCEARDSGDTEAWGTTAKEIDVAYAAIQAHRALRPKPLTMKPT